MSDPAIEREEDANAERAARKDDDAQHDDGILGSIEGMLSFVRGQDDEPESAEDIDRRRRANDEAQRP